MPDIVAHIGGRVVYIEVKKRSGKLTPAQELFRAQCEEDGVDYWLVRDVTDLELALTLPRS